MSNLTEVPLVTSPDSSGYKKQTTTDRKHPGYIEDFFDFTQPLSHQKIHEFLDFLNTVGLSVEELELVPNLLRALFDSTSQSWRPYACRVFASLSQENFKTGNLARLLEPLKNAHLRPIWVQTGDGEHIWLELDKNSSNFGDVLSDRRIIVDPTGLDVLKPAGQYEAANYLPYFGLASEAPPSLRRAYFSKKGLIFFDENNDRIGEYID